MARGTFANIRIVNKFLGGEVGPSTVFVPTKEKMYIYDAAMVRGRERERERERGTGRAQEIIMACCFNVPYVFIPDALPVAGPASSL